ncbi:hypothetical protein BST11_08645 [Mycobacterium alsense]|uniref:Hsp70 family protein n=1 Tax=Mycobacterium alsense TaxID=324058 RepID=A0AA41XRF5_9MYCO|nr:Hsp70 family protein [Mycobacterium alsense]MCV7380976.1 Hsp70 family protein [Mycobacterium alsense]OQZ91381.1 hypothetical protein BST11_08645 [Mycobacterium alsense]
MADRARTGLGLSIGATNLAAVTADVAITRKPVLTLYRQRPPEVGVPSENPRLDEPGLVVSDFVNRVGDPAGTVAADGSTHRSEALVADGLRALAYAATGGRPLPEAVAVTYPAHWPGESVDAMGAALGRVSEWSNRARPLLLIPDAAATLAAVRANPGLPGRGTVAVCDFGGSGSSITLMDAACRPVAPTVRHRDFSGDMIDQVLLTAVMDSLSSTGSVGSLSRLRGGCRGAKAQLSSNTAATIADELRGDIPVTRNELDNAIRGPLAAFADLLDDALRRNGIRDLVAVVAAGGGANIPAVTTTLSARLRVPVVTMPRPHLAAATGASLRAARAEVDDSPTALIPAAPATAPAPRVAAETSTAVLPWPQTGRTAARPAAKTEEPDLPAEEPADSRRRRLPAALIVGGAVALLLAAGAAAAIALGTGDQPATRPTRPTPSVSTTAPAPATPPPPPPSSTDTSPPATTESPAPPEAQQQTVAPAPPAAPVAPAAPAARPPLRIPSIPRIPELPPLPPIPGINEPIPGLPEIPTLLSELGPG